ncbi:MAG: S41 family peptidase [Magnetovibrio sp.]|nr:S41 family peptidase [Magnetovibrio sp.]
MNRFTQLLAFFIGGAIALSMLQSLSACSEGQVSIDQVVQAFSAGMDREAQRELSRFNDAFDTYSNDPTNDRQRDHFRNTFRLVRANYVVDVNDKKLIDDALKGIEQLKPKPRAGAVKPSVLVEAALDGMLLGLDPHSSYLNPDEYTEMRISNKGQFGGLGINIRMKDDLILIVKPIEDTPAFRAGLQADDLISHLDGIQVKGMTLTEGVKIMRGRPGEKITLTIVRKGQSPFDVVVKRAIIHVKSVRWRREADIGYIKVSGFSEQVGNKLDQAAAALFKDAKSASVSLKGMVLDLRNNPGGLLEQAVYVSDAFMQGGEIVSVHERNPRRNRVYMAEPGDLSRGLPLVVLINEGSASASEIVAEALKDQGRAVIMGRRSFGKGSVQTIQPLPAEGALRLTIALYFSPSGHTIQARGVVPDIVIKRLAPKDGEGPFKIRREEDLKDVLKGDAIPDKAVRATLQSEACPDVSSKEGDLELGCALAFLRAGSTQAFLSAIGPN